MNILLLAAGRMMAYKVLRCAAEAAGTVFVLGDQRASRLASSRYCSLFLPCPHEVSRSHAEALAGEINRIVAERGVSLVVPGDYESTYILATIRDQVRARVFPLPSHDLLEALNNKWNFHQLCRSLAIPAPASSLVADRNELARRVAASQSSTGCIAKPIDKEGGEGFLDLRSPPGEDSLHRIDYQPILMQDFVAGCDICISLFCQDGEVRASVVYTLDNHTLSFTHHEEFERYARSIAEHFKYTGVLCFDGRLSPAGRVSFIECNPRFWNNMDVAMVCGINFVALGLADHSSSRCATIESGVTFHNVTVSLPDLLRPWLFSKSDLRFLLYRLKDYRFMLHLPKASLSTPAPEPS